MSEKPPVGRTTYSVQWRCAQMAKHDGPTALPVPCEECFSMIQTNVVVPYRPYVPFTEIGVTPART